VRRWQGRHPYPGGERRCTECAAEQHSWTRAKVDTYPLPYGQIQLHHFSCACSKCLLRCGAGLVHVVVVYDLEQTMEITFDEAPAEEQTTLPERAPGENFWPDQEENAQITPADTNVSIKDMKRIIAHLKDW
jgi:hypothetical protein